MFVPRNYQFPGRIHFYTFRALLFIVCCPIISTVLCRKEPPPRSSGISECSWNIVSKFEGSRRDCSCYYRNHEKNTLSCTFRSESSAYDLGDELTANLLERMMMEHGMISKRKNVRRAKKQYMTDSASKAVIDEVFRAKGKTTLLEIDV